MVLERQLLELKENVFINLDCQVFYFGCILNFIFYSLAISLRYCVNMGSFIYVEIELINL